MSKKNIKPIVVEWGNTPAAQHPLIDPDNQYNHITQDGKKRKDELKKSDGTEDHVIAFRGKYNHAPQKDKELGLKSITHKKITEKLARLAAGKGLAIRHRDQVQGEPITAEQQKAINEVQELLRLGIEDSYKTIINSLVYYNLASVICTTKSPEYDDNSNALQLGFGYMTAPPNERFRWSRSIMNDQAKPIRPFHYYHDNWGFYNKTNRRGAYIPDLIPISEYITESQKGGEKVKEAFSVKSHEHKDAKISTHVSFAFAPSEGVFDNEYPLPKWKANSSINDIQVEFDSSCIRADYMMNGLHIFAVVNIYSKSFKDNSGIAEDGTSLEEWAEDLDVVQKLKGSHQAGRVIINPLGTDDPNMDGVVKVEKLESVFPAEVYKTINEEARAGVLTAWGVSPDLFGISKADGSNLRSQEGFMKIGILMLQEDITMYQEDFKRGMRTILDFYGHDKIDICIDPVDNSMYLAVMAEIAKDVMTENEVRAKMLSMDPLTEEELKELRESKRSKKTNSQTNQSGSDE